VHNTDLLPYYEHFTNSRQRSKACISNYERYILTS
jgi:hypothetical protein